MKIDTEGYEYEVLLGLDEKIICVEIIMFEHHYNNMIKKNYKFSDINNFFEEKIILKWFTKQRCHLEKLLNIYFNKNNY